MENVEILEQYIDDLLSECYNAALKVAYYPNLIKTRPKPENMSDDLFDEVWSWTDGLYQKSFFDRMEGRCSLKNSLNFSIEKEEKYMREFLRKLAEFE
ncbi:MAG: hypothetical protein ACKO2Z_37330 [Sphaerospermopsis kisseleviana]